MANEGEEAHGAESDSERFDKLRTSKYRGVSKSVSDKKWRAQLTMGGKTHYLGTFNTEDEAARAYDEKVVQMRGKKAKTNFNIQNYEHIMEQQAEPVNPFREGTLVGFKVLDTDGEKFWPAMITAHEDVSMYMLSVRTTEKSPHLLYLFGYRKFIWANPDLIKSFEEAFPDSVSPTDNPKTLLDIAKTEVYAEGCKMGRGAPYSETTPRLTALRILSDSILDLENRLTDCGRKPQLAFKTASPSNLAGWRNELRNAQTYKQLCDRLIVLESDLRSQVLVPWWRATSRARWLQRAHTAATLWVSEQLVTELAREAIDWTKIPRGDLQLPAARLYPEAPFMVPQQMPPPMPGVEEGVHME
eukprot:tig00000194_g14751.t1